MRLLADQILDGASVRTREFRIGDSMPGINGAVWDMNRIDTTAQQGTFERWIIRADRPQSLHIQGVMFLIKSVNGAQSMGKTGAGKTPSGWTARSNCWSTLPKALQTISRLSITVRRWSWQIGERQVSCWCSLPRHNGADCAGQGFQLLRLASAEAATSVGASDLPGPAWRYRPAVKSAPVTSPIPPQRSLRPLSCYGQR